MIQKVNKKKNVLIQELYDVEEVSAEKAKALLVQVRKKGKDQSSLQELSAIGGIENAKGVRNIKKASILIEEKAKKLPSKQKKLSEEKREEAAILKTSALLLSRVKIKQIISGAGRTKSQIATLKGLALNKIGRISELEDTAAVRGMIAKVSHLVRIL